MTWDRESEKARWRAVTAKPALLGKMTGEPFKKMELDREFGFAVFKWTLRKVVVKKILQEMTFKDPLGLRVNRGKGYGG